MPERRHERGLIDTSVVIDLPELAPEQLPVELAVSVVTLAELAAGPHATNDPDERARRQERLQQAESAFDSLAVDARVARAYGRVYSAAVASRKPHGRRAFDLLIAATAAAAELPLYTRNPGDFADLAGVVDVVSV